MLARFMLNRLLSHFMPSSKSIEDLIFIGGVDEFIVNSSPP